MVSNSFLQSDYCKRVTPYDPIRGWICFIRGWICFSQTTQCYFVLQCNSAISCLAFSQRFSENNWTIANDRRKNILLDVNNVQFDLNEAQSQILRWIQFIPWGAESFFSAAVLSVIFFDTWLCISVLNYPGCLNRNDADTVSFREWTTPNCSLFCCLVLPHIPQNLLNWTVLRLLWFWLFLVIVPACHIVQIWSLLNL